MFGRHLPVQAGVPQVVAKTLGWDVSQRVLAVARERVSKGMGSDETNQKEMEVPS